MHQALAAEVGQRLAHNGAADAVPAAERMQVDRVTRAQLAPSDHAEQFASQDRTSGQGFRHPVIV
jgi:hypothetical protein